MIADGPLFACDDNSRVLNGTENPG